MTSLSACDMRTAKRERDMKDAQTLTVMRTHTRRAVMGRAGHEAFETFTAMLGDLWNACVQERSDAYRLAGKSVTRFDQIKSTPQIRAENPEWKRFGMRPVHRFITRVDDAYKRFFNGTAGYPRYKTEKRGVRSFEVPKSGFRVRPSGKRWKIILQGFPVIKFEDLPEGDIKMLRLIKTATGMDLQFVTEEKIEVIPSDSPMAGIDVGITNQATVSNGLMFKKCERNRDGEKKFLRKAAGQVKDSKSQKKTYDSMRRAAHRENARMKNMAHRISDYIVKVCGPNIAMEELQIRNMVKNRKLARSISEALWGMVRRMLECKCRRAGGQLVLVDPKNTSKDCSACGNRKADLLLSHRVFECDECGFRAHRDLNASWNIGNRGLEALGAGERERLRGAGGCALFAGLAGVDNSGVKDFIDFESMLSIDLQGGRKDLPDAFGT